MFETIHEGDTRMAWVSDSGAKSSFEMPRYDLVYHGFLKRLAVRLGYGAKKHGENNYQSGVGDAAYRRDRLNHLVEHAMKYAAGDSGKDHLAAIAANAMILAYLDDEAKPKTNGHAVTLDDFKGEDAAAIAIHAN